MNHLMIITISITIIHAYLVKIKTKKKNLLKSRICWPNRPQSKNKESRKIDKYVDLATELERLWNIEERKMTVVVGSLWTIPKRLIKRVENLKLCECIHAMTRRVHTKEQRRIITVTRYNTINTMINSTRIARKQISKRKQVYGYFK